MDVNKMAASFSGLFKDKHIIPLNKLDKIKYSTFFEYDRVMSAE